MSAEGFKNAFKRVGLVLAIFSDYKIFNSLINLRYFYLRTRQIFTFIISLVIIAQFAHGSVFDFFLSQKSSKITVYIYYNRSL